MSVYYPHGQDWRGRAVLIISKIERLLFVLLAIVFSYTLAFAAGRFTHDCKEPVKIHRHKH